MDATNNDLEWAKHKLRELLRQLYRQAGLGLWR